MFGAPAPYRSLLRSTVRPGKSIYASGSTAILGPIRGWAQGRPLGLPAIVIPQTTKQASRVRQSELSQPSCATPGIHKKVFDLGIKYNTVMAAQVLTFVTGNANKLREVEEILASGGVPLIMQSRSIDLPEIQGTAIEVSREKCRRAAEIVGGPCITEDTSLGFVALNGLPGPYIKWFLREVGTEGLNKMLDGFETRAAFAQCNFAYSKGPGSEPIVFEGRTEGRIVLPRGPSKFGWDPVFEPIEGEGKTYAEMSSEAKNKISHRFRSLEKLRKYLEEELK